MKPTPDLGMLAREMPTDPALPAITLDDAAVEPVGPGGDPRPDFILTPEDLAAAAGLSPAPDPQPGDTRRVVRFAWWPVRTADGVAIWLERYFSVEQFGWSFGWGARAEAYDGHVPATPPSRPPERPPPRADGKVWRREGWYDP